MSGERGDRGRRSGLLGVLVALAVAAAVAAVLFASGVLSIGRPDAQPTPFATDMNGQPAALDPGEALTPHERQQQDVAEGVLGRLTVPSVGLDVPLGQMNVVGGVLTPPTFTSAYQVRNLGVSLDNTASGTVFVVMHSLRNGAVGPGNYLFNVANGTSRVQVGAEVTAGNHVYRVEGTRKVLKSALSGDREVWVAKPGRLQIITCLQKPTGGPSSDNFIVTAQLVA